MDARTGLGRFRDFRISNYQLMQELIALSAGGDVEAVLAPPDVRERAELYFELVEPFPQQLRRCGSVLGNVVVLDLRRAEQRSAEHTSELQSLLPILFAVFRFKK